MTRRRMFNFRGSLWFRLRIPLVLILLIILLALTAIMQKDKVQIDLEYYLNTSQASYQSIKKDNKCKQFLETHQNVIKASNSIEMFLKECGGAYQSTAMDRCYYSLRIIILTNNRENSLARLLTSLNTAYYGDDKVQLEIWIDRSKDGSLHYKTILEAVMFNFQHGDHEVCIRTFHMGLYGQWLASYKPDLQCSEIAVIFEDDIVASPHFYTYLRMVHTKYKSEKNINGFALHGRQQKFAFPEISGKVEIPNGNLVYLFPVLGTWGFSPKAENWSNFIKWLQQINQDNNFQPYVPNHLATEWFKAHEKQGRADEMWEIWHIYYAWKNQENTLYCYLPCKRVLYLSVSDMTVLTIWEMPSAVVGLTKCRWPTHLDEEGITQHWAEKGLHYAAGNTKPSNPLLQKWTLQYNQLPDKPIQIDIAGNVAKQLL